MIDKWNKKYPCWSLPHHLFGDGEDALIGSDGMHPILWLAIVVPAMCVWLFYVIAHACDMGGVCL